MGDEFDMAKKWPQRKTKRLCVSIDEVVYNDFKAYLDANGYDTSKYMELLLKKFLSTIDNKRNS